MIAHLINLINDALAAGSVWVYLLIFACGVVAGFTPCTYPVLPLTVGYIGHSAGGKRWAAFRMSLALVAGMALVYAVLGTVFAALGAPFGSLMGKGWVLYAVAMFFMAVGLFLLDVFSFPVPAFLQRLSVASTSERRGMMGAFVVGGVSGLIVGPCTGPILAGILAYVVASLREAHGVGYVAQAFGGGLKLFIFGLGQGALILLCGTFAGLLTRLPRAGKWLVAVKKGFALLILIGASLLLVFVGQNTDFPQLSKVLAGSQAGDAKSAESSDEANSKAPGEGVYGGDEFLK